MSGAGFNPGLIAFKLAFQLCPIFLTGGVAQQIPGQILPIILITESINLPLGLLTGGENVELDDFFAHYVPQPGGTLVDNAIAQYPFANQAVAANALIQQPLRISLRMHCPARATLGYAAKLATMLLLQSTIAQHNRTAGTYTIATPSFFYTNCIMVGFRDITGGDTHQAQSVWQLDFEQPLLTVQQALAAQNNLMSKLTGGSQIQGQPAWSGAGTNIGQPTPNTPVPVGSGAAGGQVISATPPPASFNDISAGSSAFA
jgi:hypothetical protein